MKSFKFCRECIAVVVLVLLMPLVASGEDGLLLYSSFDKFNTAPDLYSSKQCKVGGIAQDLQLRMFPNFKGQGNSVCMNNGEFISYTQEGNFRPDRGTVSFWVNLQNWDLHDTNYFDIFFEVSTGTYRMIVYKYNNHNGLVTFFLQSGEKMCSVTAPGDWLKDTWHKLDAVWNNDGMQLYVDSQLKAGSQSCKLPQGMVLPDKVGASIMLNNQKGWRSNPDWVTAYDNLKIYDRCLSSEEIVAEYEKYFPRNFESGAQPGLAVIPPVASKVTIDGKLGAEEWGSATSVPIVNRLNSKSEEDVFSRVSLQYDSEMLYLAFEVGAPAGKCEATMGDAELWFEDSVEFHTSGMDNSQYQFIFNANGAIYDAKREEPSWNSGAVAAGSRTANSWCVEAAIPLSSIGSAAKGSVLKGNFGSAQWSPYPNLHTWSLIKGKNNGFKDQASFGDLIFGESADAVRLKSWGVPTVSNLILQLEAGQGKKCSGSWQNEAGAEGKNGVDVLAEPWRVALPSGRNIVTCSVKDGKGKEIYRNQVCLKTRQSFSMDYYCLASRQLLKVNVMMRNVPAEGRECVLRFKDGSGRELASQKYVAKRESSQFEFPLPPNLPENSTYDLEVSSGGVSKSMSFAVPDMTPFRTQVAVDNEVPAPWKPVRVSGARYEVLDREYDFAGGPFPRSMTVNGEQVLARQAVLLLNGNAVQWGAILPGRNYGDHAEFTAEGSCGETKFHCKGEVWFDGMYRWDLKMTPPAAGLKIDSLKLDWACVPEASNYILAPYYVPWKDNRAELRWSVDERSSVVWLTGSDRGLAWWCRSDANWLKDAGKAQVFCRRSEKETGMTVEIIQKPGELKTQAGYTMVFQATPPRPLDTSYRGLRYHGWESGNVNCTIKGWGAERGLVADENILHWVTLCATRPERFKKVFDRYRKRGIDALIYSMPVHLPKLHPGYDYFYHEWAVTPGIRWSYVNELTGNRSYVDPCCAMTPAANWLTYNADKLLEENPGLAGVYFDISHVQQCDNPCHGCGGVDAFGKKFHSSTALSLRDFFLRMNKITHRKGRKLWLHAHNAYYPFVHDFADLWLPGEEQFYPYMRNPEKHYLTGISKEEYQSAWNSKIRGVGIMMIAQNSRVLGMNPELKKQVEVFTGNKAVAKLFTSLSLYDMALMAFHSKYEKELLFPVWEVREKVRLAEAEFHGYWVEPAVRSARENVYVSWYSWKPGAPYSRLLVIGNLNDEDCNPELTIDWKALGISPDCRFYNPFTDEEMDRDKLLVLGENYLLIGLK